MGLASLTQQPNFFLTGDGLCCVCNSFVNPDKVVHICDECNYGSHQGRCVICGNAGVTDAYYCRECVQLENDRNGCPKIGKNAYSSKTIATGVPKFASYTLRVLYVLCC